MTRRLLQTLLALASLTLTWYAGMRLLRGDIVGIVLWFAGAAVLHDLVLLPVYAAADRALTALLRERGTTTAVTGREAAPRVNYLRVPVVMSGLLFLVWFPLILGRVERYEEYTALPAGVFWERWLLITGVLFAASAAALALREWRAHRRLPDEAG